MYLNRKYTVSLWIILFSIFTNFAALCCAVLHYLVSHCGAPTLRAASADFKIFPIQETIYLDDIFKAVFGIFLTVPVSFLLKFCF
jgi:hypothetical protein